MRAGSLIGKASFVRIKANCRKLNENQPTSQKGIARVGPQVQKYGGNVITILMPRELVELSHED
jgi:hypothetical protein